MNKVTIKFDKKVDKKLTDDPSISQVGIIYKTKNYKKFVLNSINRVINQTRVNHFVKEYKERQIISPIEVMHNNDGKLVILDGQHRFRAWMKLGLPVYFYETISGDDSTQGLRQRNQGKAWNTLDTVNSFAADDRNKEVQKQYRDLQAIIMFTQNKLGRLPLIPLIELAEGIDKVLDQRIVYSHYDFKNGNYRTYNRPEFEKVILRIADMQSKLDNPISLTAAMFRALFTIMGNQYANASYMAQCINQDRPAFNAIAVSNNNFEVGKQMLYLYNAKAILNGQKPISYALGIDGVILKDKYFKLFLKNKK